MATPRAQSVASQIKQFAPFANIHEGTLAELERRLAGGANPDALVKEALTQYGEIGEGAQMAAKARYAPRLDELTLEEQTAQTNAALARERIKQNQASIEDEIADAIRNTKKNQEAQDIAFLNKQQRLGVRASGLTVGGLQESATRTTEDLNRLERDRANKLAEQAILSTQNENVLTSAQRRAQIARSEITTDIGALANQLIEQSRSELEKAVKNRDSEAFERALKIAQLANDIEQGQSVDLGQFGVVKGIKKKTTTGSGGGGGITSDQDSIDSYAQSLADGDIKATQVPSRYRAAALKRADEIRAGQNNPQQVVSTLQQYKNQGWSRRDIEKQYEADSPDGTVPDYIRSALDVLYFVPPAPTQSPVQKPKPTTTPNQAFKNAQVKQREQANKIFGMK